MAELVQAFRFRVQLSRSLPGRTLTPPPALDLSEAPDTSPRNPQRGPGADGAPPLSTASSAGNRAGGAQTLGDGGFQECTGLDVEADIREYLEGGANDTVIRRVGRLKAATLVLKRGMLVPTDGGRADTALWDWLQGTVSSALPVPRYDGVVEAFEPTNTRAVARWTFRRGLPLKVTGPALHAVTGTIAVEELHIQHEGLRLETSS
jgi:phage tail-like protein